MDKTIDEKWTYSLYKCDCCKLEKPGQISEEHVAVGFSLSGLNFQFCDDCYRDRQSDCDKIIYDGIISFKKHCEEMRALAIARGDYVPPQEPPTQPKLTIWQKLRSWLTW